MSVLKNLAGACIRKINGERRTFEWSSVFVLTFILTFTILFLIEVHADVTSRQPSPSRDIGLVEHLGEKVPLDLKFTDSNGDPLLLSDYVDKPTVLSIVYFNCPGICSPLLSGVVDVLDRLDLEPGKDYEALTVSFNPHEGPELAREKKRNYFHSFQRGRFPPEHWKWVTGDESTINQLTDAVGFKYKKVDDNQYIHAGFITVLSRDGKISRYLRGIEFQPFNVKMAITEASEGKTGQTISKLLLYCFSYDPAGKKYVLNFTKIFGTAFLLFLVLFIAFLTYQGKLRKKKVRK